MLHKFQFGRLRSYQHDLEVSSFTPFEGPRLIYMAGSDVMEESLVVAKDCNDEELAMVRPIKKLTLHGRSTDLCTVLLHCVVWA